jgi:hypothetical protein
MNVYLIKYGLRVWSAIVDEPKIQEREGMYNADDHSLLSDDLRD